MTKETMPFTTLFHQLSDLTVQSRFKNLYPALRVSAFHIHNHYWVKRDAPETLSDWAKEASHIASALAQPDQVQTYIQAENIAAQAADTAQVSRHELAKAINMAVRYTIATSTELLHRSQNPLRWNPHSPLLLNQEQYTRLEKARHIVDLFRQVENHTTKPAVLFVSHIRQDPETTPPAEARKLYQRIKNFLLTEEFDYTTGYQHEPALPPETIITIAADNATTAYQYQRFPWTPKSQQTTLDDVTIFYTQVTPPTSPDTVKREQIRLSATRYYRGIRYINLPPAWPRDNTTLALELNDLALQESEVDPLQSFRTFRAALSHDDQIAPIWNNLGLSYLEAGDLNQAEQHFLKAIAIDDSLSAAWGNLGLAYIETGHYPDAWHRLTQAISLDPSDPLHLNNLGVLHLELDQPDIAKDLFEAAITADPVFHLAYYNLGMATDMLGFHEKSNLHYAEGLRIAEQRSYQVNPEV